MNPADFSRRAPRLTAPAAILFDVDGTLYSQRRLRARLLPKLVASLAISPRTSWEAMRALAAYRKALELLRLENTPGPIPERQFQLAAQLTGMPPDSIRRHVQHWFVDEAIPMLSGCCRRGLTGLLEFARAQGIRLGAFSDYPPEDKLKALGISQFFDVVASAGDPEIQAYKPNPRGLQVTLKRLGVEPHQALYIGDRPEVDAAAAARAGVQAVIICGPRQTRGWIAIERYEQLHSLLREAVGIAL